MKTIWVLFSRINIVLLIISHFKCAIFNLFGLSKGLQLLDHLLIISLAIRVILRLA